MSTKQLSPEKLAQLARARELAEVARQRIRNLSDGEKADHLRAKAEALQKRSEARSARQAKKTAKEPQISEVVSADVSWRNR